MGPSFGAQGAQASNGSGPWPGPPGAQAKLGPLGPAGPGPSGRLIAVAARLAVTVQVRPEGYWCDFLWRVFGLMRAWPAIPLEAGVGAGAAEDDGVKLGVTTGAAGAALEVPEL